MATKRLTMRKIGEVLRLSLSAQLSIRQISRSTKVSVGAIQKLLSKANELGLEWPLPEELDEVSLAQLFYPKSDAQSTPHLQQPDWPCVHQELKRKGVTKQLLWEEYCQEYPNRSYSYSQFCERYRQWLGKQKRSMRQIHKAGEKCFVDYCGLTVPIINSATNETREAQVFAGVLGASNYTFAEATYSQSLPDWLGSHARMFEYFGGCSEIIVPDNLRSGVSKACRYDPDLNPSYQQLAAHYGVAVIPARPYKPKDKAKAEVGVQLVERWILARLRKQRFFSLQELNQYVSKLLEELNLKPFKQLAGNRKQAFEQLDKPALRPLPAHAYQYVEIKQVKVNIDYHIEYHKHLYSVPHQYVGETLELHAGENMISLYFRQQKVATHPRKHRPGTTTVGSHMPQRHQKHQKWTQGRLKTWAKDQGPNVLKWLERQLISKTHPEQAYRVCLGLLNLCKEYPTQRINDACGIANREGLYRLKHIKSILKSNLDQLPKQLALPVTLPQHHGNIRGANHFN